MEAIKTFFKKSHFVHATYKLGMRLHQIPASNIRSLHEFRSIYRVLPNTMLSLPRLANAYDCVVSINKEGIEGDIVECGVWSGGCVGLMALAHNESGKIRREFHLFDSFEGLHQPSLKDTDFLDEPLLSNGTAELKATGACVGGSREFVEDFLVNRLNLNPQTLRFHVGWFRDTIPIAAPGIDKIALLRLDGDLYESTKQALEGLYEQVQPGGYVIIDDFGFAGCRQALVEYFAVHGELPELLPIDAQSVYFRKPA